MRGPLLPHEFGHLEQMLGRFGLVSENEGLGTGEHPVPVEEDTLSDGGYPELARFEDDDTDRDVEVVLPLDLSDECALCPRELREPGVESERDEARGVLVLYLLFLNPGG